MMIEPDPHAVQQVLAAARDHEIAQLESRLRVAQLTANIAELDALISERLLFTGPDGHLATKAQDVEAHRSGTVRFLKHLPIDLAVRRVGQDVAVVSLLADLSVSVFGSVEEGRFRYTRVWARENESHWCVVGGHVSAAQGTGT